jgi:hypothetical protein
MKCRKKKEEPEETPQQQRAADNRLRGRLNKATEKIQVSNDALDKIRKRTDKPKKKGKKDK